MDWGKIRCLHDSLTDCHLLQNPETKSRLPPSNISHIIRTIGDSHTAGRLLTAGALASTALSSFLFQHRPIESVVVLMVQRAKQDAEQLTQIHIIRRLVESQPAAIIQVHCEFGRESLKERRELGSYLLYNCRST